MGGRADPILLCWVTRWDPGSNEYYCGRKGRYVIVLGNKMGAAYIIVGGKGRSRETRGNHGIRRGEGAKDSGADDQSSSFSYLIDMITIVTIMEMTLITSVVIMMLFCWFQRQREIKES